MVPVSHMERLRKEAEKSALFTSLHFIKEGSHNTGWRVNKKTYFGSIQKFIEDSTKLV